MNHPRGKGLWVNRASQVLALYPSAADAARAAAKAGFSHVFPKVANGAYPWLPNTPEAKGLRDLIWACRDFDLKVYPWQYYYAVVHNAVAEAGAALRAWDSYGTFSSGWVIDAEAEFKADGARDWTRKLIRSLREYLPENLPIGFTSYRYPALHPEFPWLEILLTCDFACPQVYWEQRKANDPPSNQLRKCLDQYRAVHDTPIYPIGSAYRTTFWKPTIWDEDDFERGCRGKGLVALSWWTWDHAIHTGLWDRLATYAWPTAAGGKRHWGSLAPDEKDGVLLKAVQSLGLVDGEGFVVE